MKPKTPEAPALMASGVKRAEYERAIHVINVTVPFEVVLQPTFYTHVTDKFKVGHRIEVYPEDKSYYAELMVMSVQKLAMSVAVINHVALQKGTEMMKTNEYEVDHLGTKRMFSVIRLSDKQVVSDGHQTIEEANRSLVDLIQEAVA